MTELKTLKDMQTFPNVIGNEVFIHKGQCKEEAIKRYKYWRKMSSSPPDMETLVNHMQIWGRMAELKDVFNITDEEIK